jgi:hypothetical protein
LIELCMMNHLGFNLTYDASSGQWTDGIGQSKFPPHVSQMG